MKLQKCIIFTFVIIFLISGLSAVDKKWEIELHFSSWSINFLSSTVTGVIEDEIDEYDPEKGELTFNSHGTNLGIGVRYYPGGKTGSLSFGLSHERNNFIIDLTGKYIKADSIGQQMVIDGSGKIELYPHSFHFNIRWDILPTYRIHPYFGFGFGIGVLNGNVEAYATSVTTLYNGETIEAVEYDENDTLNELINEYKEEGNSLPIRFLPFLQMQFGVKGEVAKDTYLLAEFQFYNGFSFKGGVSYRF